jgi:hypothetical protein
LETCGTVKEGGYLLIALPDNEVYPDPGEMAFRELGHATTISEEDLKFALSEDKYKFIIEQKICSANVKKDDFDYNALNTNCYHSLYVVKILNKKE